MEKIKVVIADDNRDFRETLQEYLNNQDDMEVVGAACDGCEAVEMIRKEIPDIAILDIVMPHLDGLGVLDQISSIKNKPHIIMLSAIGQDSITKKALSLGAEYFILKPFNLDILASRIRQLQIPSHDNNLCDSKPKQKEKNIAYEVTNILHQIGVPAHMRGYNFLRESVMMVLEDVNVINSIIKQIYPPIAHKFNTTPSKVERAIRNAIKASWDKGDLKRFDAIFGYTVNIGKDTPTNSQFIAMVAEKLRIQHLQDS